MMLAACGDDEPTPQVAGSRSGQGATTSTTASDPSATTPPQLSALPPSIININTVDQISEQMAIGQGILQSFTWSSDPHTLVVLATDGIHLYDTQHLDNPPRTFADYTDFVVFSPDGTVAISKLFDGAIVLWDTGSGERLAFVETIHPLTSSLHFSPDGAQIVGIEDETIKIWNAADGQLADTITLDATTYHTVFYRDDGTLLSLVSEDQTVALRAVQDDNEIFSIPTAYTFFRLQSAISADGHVMAVPIYFQEAGYIEIQLWDTESGEAFNPVTDFRVNFSPDGKAFTYIDHESTVVVRDTATQDTLALMVVTSARTGPFTFGGTARPSNALFNADGSLIAALDMFGKLTLFSLENGEPLAEISDFRPVVVAADLSSDGQTLLIGYADGGLELWDVPSGERYGELQVNRLSAAIFADDDPATFLSGGDNISRWNTDSPDSPTLVTSLDGTRLVFNPDHTLLAIGYDATVRFSDSHDGFVRLWDLETGELHVADIDLPDDHAPDKMVFSPDGKQLAVGFNAPSVIIYTVDTGHEAHQFDTVESVRDVAISPDGRQLAAVTTTELPQPDFIDPLAEPIITTGQLWIWDIDSGEGGSVAEIEAPVITGVAYSPDGSLMAVGGQFEAGGIALLDAETHDIVGYLGDSNQAAQRLQFSADGATILSIGADNIVRMWALSD
jgi:WD40 repeat protein